MNNTQKNEKITLYNNDITQNLYNIYKDSSYLAVDTEAMGLIHGRDRLCLIQISNEFHLTSCIKIELNNSDSPHIKKLFEDNKIMKIFHYARFDVAALKCNLNINTNNIFCTKIASKLARTYTHKHGLKELIHELIGIELDKSSQSSDWGSCEDLSDKQIDYAANDVKYLIEAMRKLRIILEREGRYDLAQKCFQTIPVHSELDILKFSNIFEH
ncbi:putative ribonuclease D [Prochlorococcus marinus str. MIT 9515]|uniref:Putative ribonuclease D n=1 Tax=Prochlorococcus marinus (strain MIT 9515) TaxID=167542 RepID=A2BYW7_PROM5|nr:ribonuclease D [Prochlorococcus marinus]ABM72978.1 putative ribonuclease D [Prochlorococcus marinus str. MIT 9515]